MPKYVRGEGNPKAKLMIVGEAPGKLEDDLGRPFVGPSGELLDIFLKEAGLDRSAVYVTNVRKYRPPFNKYHLMNPGEPPLEEQRQQLWNEIDAIKPNCILALGDKALSALTGNSGIHKWRGSILKARNGTTKVVATFHPANFLRDKETEGGKGMFKYSYKYVVRHDFARAIEESRTEGLCLPERNLEICRNSMQLRRFLDRSDWSQPLSVDIESSNCIPICIGIAFGKFEAISIPIFNRLSHLNFEGIAEHDLAFIWKDLDEAIRTCRVLGQNFKYDHEKIYRLGFRPNVWGDTQLLAHTVNPEMPAKSIAFLQSIYTREPFHKEEGEDFWKDRGKKAKANLKLDDLLLYNAKDAVVTWEIHEAMLEEAREKNLEEWYFRCVMPRHKFYLDMERVGFKVDEVKREALLDKYLMMYEQIHDNTTEVLGHELNVASNPQVTKCLFQELKFPTRIKRGSRKEETPDGTLTADEETITALLANHAKTPQQKIIANNILDERKIRKTISTYILAKPDYDGRMRTSYNITGAETDRTSTSNISRPVRPETSMGLGFQTLTKHGDIGADICEMFVPDNGLVFLNVDLSQAEARVVFVLAQEWEVLNKLNVPTWDIHWSTAKLFFAELPPTVEECKALLSKEDPRRFIGKTIRHAGHLGAMKKRVMETVNTDAKKYGIDISISEWRAGKYLDAFHAANPNIRGVFHKEVEEILAKERILMGPRLIAPDGEPAPCGRWRMFFDRWSNELVKQALAEIPQHTVSNQTKFAGIRIKRRIPDLQFILEGHDALLMQVPKRDVEAIAKVVREEIEKPIDFMTCSLKRDYQLIIPADFQIGEKNYKDLEKLKVA
jgi:uracil-DNA glycosylase family 4